MKIKSLKAKNFWSYETLDFTFDKGLCLIEGINYDEGGSNGSGKSTILNCLCYGIFGDLPKKLKVDSIINRNAESGCFVEVEFEEKNVNYRIERGRNPNLLNFYVNGELKSDVDTKATQHLIEKTIGVNYDIFLASTYFSQNSHNFLHGNDESKKAIMTEISDLGNFDLAEAKARDELKNEEISFVSLNSKIKTSESNLAIYESQKLDFVEKSKFFDEDRKNKLNRLEGEIASCEMEANKKISEATDLTYQLSNHKAIYSEFIEKEKPSILNSILQIEESYNSCLKMAATIEAESNSLKRQVSKFSLPDSEQEIQVLNSDIINGDLALKNLNDKITTVSSEIKFVTASGIKLDSDIKRIKDILSSKKTLLEELSAEVLKLQTHININKSAIAKLSLTDDTCPTCKQRVDHNLLEQKKNEITLENEQFEAQIKDITNRISFEEGEYEIINVVSQLEQDKNESLELLNKLNAELQNTQWNQKAYVDGRIRTLNKIEEISKKIAEYKENSEKLTLNTEKKKEIEAILEKLPTSTINIKRSEIDSKEKHLSSLIEKTTSQIDILYVQIENYNKKIADLKRSYDEISTESNPYKKTISETTKKIDDLIYELAFERVEIKGIAKKIQDLIFLREVFSNKGVKSYVFDSIINELNFRISGYLRDLFSESVRITFLAESETSKGEIRQKFSTKYYVNNIEVEHGSFSGGEDKRLQFAVNLSLAEICANRSLRSFNILFFDESFDGLDHDGKEKCMALLQRISEKKDCVLVIDHASEFQSSFENVVTCEKRNGISILRG